MEYTIERTSRFKREYKLIKKRGYDISLLKAVIERAASRAEQRPPASFKLERIQGMSYLK